MYYMVFILFALLVWLYPSRLDFNRFSLRKKLFFRNSTHSPIYSIMSFSYGFTSQYCVILSSDRKPSWSIISTVRPHNLQGHHISFLCICYVVRGLANPTRFLSSNHSDWSCNNPFSSYNSLPALALGAATFLLDWTDSLLLPLAQGQLPRYWLKTFNSYLQGLW